MLNLCVIENAKMDVDYSDYSDSDYEASRSSVSKMATENIPSGSSENKEPQPVTTNEDKPSSAIPRTEPESQESDSDAPPKKIKKPNSPMNTPLLNLFLTSPHTERTATPPSSPSAMVFSNSSPPLPPRTPTPPSRAPIIVTSKNVATAIAMAMEQTSGNKSGGAKDGVGGSTDNMSLENLNLNPLIPNTSQAPTVGVQSNSSSGMKSVIVRAGSSTQGTVSVV